MRQILFNLLSNAIGFLRAGPDCTIAAMRPNEEMVFKVTDQGRGIPADVIDHVFDRFRTRLSVSRHRGVGLGLSIVKSFVELHDGKVTIDSSPGEELSSPVSFRRASSGRKRPAKRHDGAAPYNGRTGPGKDRGRDDLVAGFTGRAFDGALAQHVAEIVSAGDLVTLSAIWVRAIPSFARALCGTSAWDDDLEVSQPHFTLMQVMSVRNIRLFTPISIASKSTEELVRTWLGRKHRRNALVLVEWPERAADILNADRLDIAFLRGARAGRNMAAGAMTGYGAMAHKLAGR